ncbi:MAG: 2-amino-4-hydroxy-6-hydroxymethyldihydropteridine diphosphokinase [Deltaproteobacteria bacterium]|nr:2-amino-4-hydroxy-6-hydroxymethyldihydropteridine diphosphokinase [Deltaproteobacteria bacterium]
MVATEVLIGFGSNLGDRCGLINQALKRLADLPGTSLLKISSLYESAPVGYLAQGAFLNGVVLMRTFLEPRPLLGFLLEIENLLGRVRKQRWGPRTIDLDILFYGHAEIVEDYLTVPHPEIGRRLFVLEPLCEVAPEWSGPIGKVADQLRIYRELNPEASACRVVAAPAVPDIRKVTDGIFYRYSQS